MFEILYYLSSGLFLGWSLGANDASNAFGTAVGTRMIRFTTAATICSIFVILGSISAGSATSSTLNQLGTVHTMPAAFTVTFSAALCLTLMTKFGLPVSSSQAIVGAIIGWNFFIHAPTDINVFSKIVSTWFICPLLAMFFSATLYQLTKYYMRHQVIHILRQDTYTRIGLVVAGAFASYSLGANNIANVMGVFIPAAPFKELSIFGIIISPLQQLFFIGGLSIALGVFTYSKKVMLTVGEGLAKLNPIGALIVVFSSGLVLFMFSSKELHHFMDNLGLPPIPMVPVSSSQAVVGAVIGIAVSKSGFKEVNLTKLRDISIGWVLTPVAAALFSFMALFFMKNVFMTNIL